MWLVLLQWYEGTNSENSHIVLPNQAIPLHPQQRLFYKNKYTFLFTKYTSGLQAAFVAITKYQNQVKYENMVQKLIYGIQVQSGQDQSQGQ